MNIINKIAAATLTGAVICTGMFSGCFFIEERFSEALALPDNAQEFVTVEHDSSSLESMEVNGRTYEPYGELRGMMHNDSIRECLGYVDGDRQTRVYTLYEDPYDNYILVRDVNSNSHNYVYWRDMSTYGEDIFTPEYICSLEYEDWGNNSGVYYQIREMYVDVTIKADGVRELDYEYTINGLQGGEGGVGFVGGEPFNIGDAASCDISEVSLHDKFPVDEPFDVVMKFYVLLEDGTAVEVSGVFEGTVELGQTYEMELTGSPAEGYKIA